MDNELKNIFKDIKNLDVMEQFLAILDLDDNNFNTVYPKLKEGIIDAFNLNSTRKTIIENLNSAPEVNIDEEMAGIEEMIQEVKNDDSLSDNKKDIIITLLSKTIETTNSLLKNPREKITVKVQKISKDAILPTYAHDTDAGADIYAIEDVVLEPHTTQIIKTGLKIAIPAGYEIQIRARSGLSLKTSLRIANCIGTIDSQYRGEIGVIMENTGDSNIIINKGDKIAQMLIAPTPMIQWEEVNELDKTSRGEGGYGSTDKS